MKREFLEELGLEKDVIDKIMAVNGSDIEVNKQEATRLSEELEGVKIQLADAGKTIKEFENLDIEKIKQTAIDWEKKYNKETQNLQDKIKQKDYDHAVDSYLNGFKFTSDLVKKAVKSEFMSKDFRLDEGKFLGADDYMEKLKTDDAAIFMADDSEGGKPKISTGGTHGNGGLVDPFEASLMKGAGLKIDKGE